MVKIYYKIESFKYAFGLIHSMEKEEVLKEFGLNEKEVRVYLASLELGLSRVNDIAKKAGIIRETTYSVINSLIKKGLMSYVIKSGVKYFEAADPEKLTVILQEKERLVDEILPELETIKKTRIVKPKIEFYEGKEGIKTILEDVLKETKQELLSISSTKNLRLILRFYFPHFVQRRIKKGIKVRLLTDAEVESRELLRFKYLPKGFKLKTTNMFYGNKIAMISLEQKEPIGVIIENKEISDTQKDIFNLLWKLVK